MGLKKIFVVCLTLAIRYSAHSQLPNLYLYKDEEKHLSLFGQPKKVEEFYYEYRSQIRAHTYNHFLTYDGMGRTVLHQKNNIGLYDSLPQIFKNFTDSNAISITYQITYDSIGHLKDYEYLKTQENNLPYKIIEHWKYDAFDMLTEDILMEYDGSVTKMNSNSTKRHITRQSNKMEQIVKYEYVFLKKGLKPYEAELFEYQNDSIKQIKIYYINTDSIALLREIKTNLVFRNYNDLNTDRLLLSSYTSNRSNGDTLLFYLNYDINLKPLSTIGVLKNSITDTVVYKIWNYTDSSLTYYTSKIDYKTFIYDASKYSKTEIEYLDNYPTFELPDYITRDFENGKLASELINIWESAINIWLKDKEYVYYYDDPTGLVLEQSAVRKRSVYPNPASQWIAIETEKSLEIELYNLLGGLVLKSKISKEQKLDLTSLDKGMYFYRLESGDQGKLLVE